MGFAASHTKYWEYKFRQSCKIICDRRLRSPDKIQKNIHRLENDAVI